MIYKQISKSALLIWLLFSFYSCSYDGPTDVYNPDETGNATPEITSIEPAALALAQYTQVKISGKNFGSGLDSSLSNIVYFNNKKGTIISESQTEIVVVPPDISGDEITIKISVPGAFELAEFQNYRIELLSVKSDAFIPTDQILAIAVDANENLYAAIKDRLITIYKIEPGKQKAEYGTLPFPVISEMKVGPNNELYFQITTKDLYKLSAEGGKAEKYVTLPQKVKYFDFDENQNIYSGGTKSGVFRITSDGNYTEVGSMADFDITSIRVFSGYVHFSAYYKGDDTSVPSSGVWKSQILSDGNLAETELVYDWSESDSFSESKIGTLTFATDGTMFIGSDNEDNPIAVVYPDGSSEALYSGLLSTKTVQFVWGNTNILYHNVINNDDEIKGVNEIFISDWEGAPYYGRE